MSLLTDALWRERSLVKTYGPRGTVHVFAAQELSLWTAATRALSAKGSRQPPPSESAVLPTPAQSEELRAAVRSVTRGTQLTRDELGAAITAQCGPWVNTQATPAWSTGWPHWRLAVDEAVAKGVLCFGAPQGNRVTFVRADEWLRDTVTQVWSAVEDAIEDAMVDAAPAVLVEVARRYLDAYAPATHQEFAGRGSSRSARRTRVRPGQCQAVSLRTVAGPADRWPGFRRLDLPQSRARRRYRTGQGRGVRTGRCRPAQLLTSEVARLAKLLRSRPHPLGRPGGHRRPPVT